MAVINLRGRNYVWNNPQKLDIELLKVRVLKLWLPLPFSLNIEKEVEYVYGTWIYPRGFPGGSVVQYPPAKQKMWVPSIPGSGNALEKEMAIHFIILAWEIPWTEELQSMELQKSWTCPSNYTANSNIPQYSHIVLGFDNW